MFKVNIVVHDRCLVPLLLQHRYPKCPCQGRLGVCLDSNLYVVSCVEFNSLLEF